MTWSLQTQSKAKPILLAFGLALSCQSAFAATMIVVKNNGPVGVQIGFDSAATTNIAPRETARLSLNDGDHTAQCRYEGYDGCNLAGSFTTEGVKELTLNLQPVFTLEHAVALVGQGMLSLETRPDVWATTTQDVAGALEDCSDYTRGKLNAVLRRVRARSSIRNATLVMQNLCGRPTSGVAATIDGTQLYFPLRSVMFKEKSGRPVLVQQ
jgi:hypothetical protein